MHRLVAELMLHLFQGAMAMEAPVAVPSRSAGPLQEVDVATVTPEPLFMDMCNRDAVPGDLAIICEQR